MSELSKLAQIASRSPFFLGSVLAFIANRDRLSDEKLAAYLDCSRDSLARLRLCRTPDADAQTFAADVRRIAQYCEVDFTVLLSFIKDVSISESIRQASSDADAGWLMAARDRHSDNA